MDPDDHFLLGDRDFDQGLLGGDDVDITFRGTMQLHHFARAILGRNSPISLRR